MNSVSLYVNVLAWLVIWYELLVQYFLVFESQISIYRWHRFVALILPVACDCIISRYVRFVFLQYGLLISFSEQNLAKVSIVLLKYQDNGFKCYCMLYPSVKLYGLACSKMYDNRTHLYSKDIFTGSLNINLTHPVTINEPCYTTPWGIFLSCKKKVYTYQIAQNRSTYSLIIDQHNNN